MAMNNHKPVTDGLSHKQKNFVWNWTTWKLLKCLFILYLMADAIFSWIYIDPLCMILQNFQFSGKYTSAEHI